MGSSSTMLRRECREPPPDPGPDPAILSDPPPSVESVFFRPRAGEPGDTEPGPPDPDPAAFLFSRHRLPAPRYPSVDRHSERTDHPVGLGEETGDNVDVSGGEFARSSSFSFARGFTPLGGGEAASDETFIFSRPSRNVFIFSSFGEGGEGSCSALMRDLGTGMATAAPGVNLSLAISIVWPETAPNPRGISTRMVSVTASKSYGTTVSSISPSRLQSSLSSASPSPSASATISWMSRTRSVCSCGTRAAKSGIRFSSEPPLDECDSNES